MALMKLTRGALSVGAEGTSAYAPLFTQGQLTVANLISDDTRLAGVQGDGAAYPDSSVGVWPAATNLYPNGGFESGTSTWINGARATWSRSSEQAKFGTYSGKLTCDGTGTQLGISGNLSGILSTTTQYVISMWVYIPSGWDGGNVVASDAGTFSGATIVNGTASAALVDQWQRITMTLLTAADVNGNVYLYSSSTPTSGKAIYIDGFQLETGSIATPYIETDGGTASRSAPTISTSFNGVTTSGWVAMRLRAGHASTVVNATDKILFTLKESTNVRFEVAEYAGNGDRFYTRAVDGGGTSIVYLDVSADLAGSFAVGDAQTIVGYWANGGNVGLSYNGSNFLTAANARTISAPTELFIGQGHLGSYNPAVDYKWLAVGKGTLTNTQAAAIHALGNNDPLPHMFPSSAQLSFLAHFNGDGTFYRRSV